ncbi:hypothetical protein Tco_0333572, partial [Tanacetum coccineum]
FGRLLLFSAAVCFACLLVSCCGCFGLFVPGSAVCFAAGFSRLAAGLFAGQTQVARLFGLSVLG